MFDPTIYENMKVVLEGVIYDLDLEGQIQIIDRKDLINLAVMAREYHCSFRLEKANATATITLEAQTEDLTGEILEAKNEQLGCKLMIFFTIPIKDEQSDLSILQDLMTQTWHSRPTISQIVSYDWLNHTKCNLVSKVGLHFNRKINEGHLQDFPSLLDTTVHTLKKVSKLNE